jgi:hypothetical protein
MWFLARPLSLLQLRGTFLSLWDDILPVIPEQQWRENLALVAAWLAEFGGRAIAEPPHIQWQSPSTISESPLVSLSGDGPELDDSAGSNVDTPPSDSVVAEAAKEAATDDDQPAGPADGGTSKTDQDGPAADEPQSQPDRRKGRGVKARARP